MSSKERLNLAEQPISPHIVRFFEDYGDTTIKAYASTQLFHATHSSNLGTISQDGLRSNASIIDPDDSAYIEDMFQRYGSKHPQDIFSFRHFILGERDGEKRGLYFTPYWRGKRTTPDNTAYGLPERLMFSMRELDFLSKNQAINEAETNQAKEIFAKYYDRLFSGKPSIVLLEADPFAPGIINDRLSGVDRLRDEDPETIKFVLRSLDHYAPAGVNVRGPVEPGYLAIASAQPFDSKYWSENLTMNRTSYFDT